MRRVFGIVAASFVALLLVAVALLYWLLSGDGIRVAIEQQASAWLGQPVAIGSARVALWPRAAISLQQVGVGQPVRLRLETVDVSGSLMALLSRRVEDAEVRIRNTRLDLPLSVRLPAASAPATDNGQKPTADDTAGSSFRIVSVSSIVLDDVVISSLGRELTLSSESSLVGSRLLVRDLKAGSGRTAIRASGTIALEPRVDADLRIDAERLDMDELMVLGAAFLPAPSAAGGQKPPPRLHATITASTAQAAGVDVRQLTGTMTVDGSRVALSPLSFELLGGRYEGAIEARLGKEITASLRAQLSGVDMAQVAAFGSSPDTITGTLLGNATVTGTGQDLASVLAGARGTGTMVIANGSLQRLGLVRTVVLFFGRPEANAPASTDRFDRLDARFSLAGGNLRADGFALRSPDLDGTGSGTLNLKARTLSGRMNVTLSEALSQQAGTDLRRFTREGNRVVLPVVLGGTLNAPSVTIDAAAALQRGLQNEAERQLKGILDRFK